MGLFDFLKKKSVKTNSDDRTTKNHEAKVNITFTETVNGKERTVTAQIPKDDDLFPTDFEHLTKDGELPWGWVTRNKEFCDKINGEYSYFLNMWLDSRSKSPMDQYSALKSFVLYLYDVEKLCKSKGECFEFWFYEILTGNGYIEKRKKELDELTANLDELQKNYTKRNDLLPGLDERIINMLIDNPGVLQSDFVKMFDPLVQNDVREKLYFMEKAGKLERTKSGRSYILHYKQ